MEGSLQLRCGRSSIDPERQRAERAASQGSTPPGARDLSDYTRLGDAHRIARHNVAADLNGRTAPVRTSSTCPIRPPAPRR